MATLPEILPETTMRVKRPSRKRLQAAAGAAPVLLPWLRAQSINVTRHAAALRPFKREEFGTGAAAPSEGHIQVVNQLITKLRRGLLKMSGKVHDSIDAAIETPSSPELQHVVASMTRRIAGCRASRRSGISISSSSASAKANTGIGC
jgi:hypothetical protein